jgi:integrase/recombinase XerD
MKQTDFAKYLTYFFSKYLPGQRNLSTNTISSYRDTFKLLLKFLNIELNTKPDRLTFSMIDAEAILKFLDWLEKTRETGISTRNQRLAAIHSFYRYVQMENPELLLKCQQILNIPFKKKSNKPIDYLMPPALKAMLEQADTSVAKGRRDLVLMVTLYDTGARVQELIDLKVRDVRLDFPAVINLTGKGNKKRSVPIMSKTLLLLKNYLEENKMTINGKQDHPLFFNSKHEKFTRHGVSYILNKYFHAAKETSKTVIFPEILTPHMIRHTKAMHLIEAGVNLIYIRDFLGHVSVITTERYAQANSDMKRKALETAYRDLVSGDVQNWKQDQGLLEWLQDFCK